MTINLKNFLNDKRKMSKMGEFQELKTIDGLEISSVSADLYDNGRDDLSLFYFREGAHYACLQTSSSIISESLNWNEKSNKKSIKAVIVNTKNANTFTGKQGYESLKRIADLISKKLTEKQVQDENIPKKITPNEIIFGCTGTIGEIFPCDEIINQIPKDINPLI